VIGKRWQEVADPHFTAMVADTGQTTIYGASGEVYDFRVVKIEAADGSCPGSVVVAGRFVSYGEIVDPDAYAMSFWYDCALIVFLAEPYGIDFVRHRCRQVARELANLLPMLEPDPDAPAAIRRRPPTLP